jgi:hypothetical protein
MSQLLTHYGSAFFTRVVRSKSTPQRQLRGEIKKKHPILIQWNISKKKKIPKYQGYKNMSI